eukprot:gene65-99_t
MRFAQREFCSIQGGGARILAVHGVSHAPTPAQHTFIDRAGVCRDFTHLGIALTRALNIPARAVSAYALDGRWWLVDPEGYAFIHVGVVATSYPKGSSAPDPATWAAQTTELLHAHGFNGTGAWSDTALLRATQRPVVYTPMWNFMGAYGAKRGGTYQKSGHLGYPGDCIFVFDPAFPAFCDDYAKRLAATKDDPWLLGHFSDNELPLYT